MPLAKIEIEGADDLEEAEWIVCWCANDVDCTVPGMVGFVCEAYGTPLCWSVYRARILLAARGVERPSPPWCRMEMDFAYWLERVVKVSAEEFREMTPEKVEELVDRFIFDCYVCPRLAWRAKRPRSLG